MRVMVTGGTGFIGYHTVMALLDAGLEVSLLVRNIDKMERIYGPGVIQHHTVGDIGDAASVREALEGCDGVVHVAALVSTHAADAERVYRTNLQGAHNVLGEAAEMGMQTIIHVSSVTAIYDPAASVLNEDSPPGPSPRGYGRSKVACEEYARSLQAQGASGFYYLSRIGDGARCPGDDRSPYWSANLPEQICSADVERQSVC